MSRRFTAFKEHVGDEVGRRGWFRIGGAIPLVLALVVFALAGGVLVFFAVHHWRPVYPRYSMSSSSASAAASSRTRPLCLGTLVFNRRMWRRRTRAGEEEAERWEAFRRYLTDFPRLQEAAARDARALGALPRLRHRVRDRRACPPGRAAAHARGAARRQLDLLDLARQRPRLGRREPRRSAISPPASAPRSRHRTRAGAEAAAASPAAVAEAAAVAAGRLPASRARSRRAIWCPALDRGTLTRTTSGTR